MKQAHENGSLEDLSGTLSSTHINTEENLTADKLLDELPLPQQEGLYMNGANATSRNTYDQFFEEVSLDLPRDSQHYHQQQQQDAEQPSRLMKFMPRRGTVVTNGHTSKTSSVTSPISTAASASANNTITPSDISGPFYSISDVLDDSVSPTATAAAMAAASASHHHHHGNNDAYDSIDMSQPSTNPRAARRNVNEAEVVVTSGGASIPTRRKSTLNPFKRSKSVSQKPSPLETVISKTRPRMLPPKDPHEEKKHLQEYESMMKQAKKLEAKKQRESNKKREEKDKKASYAIYTWENDIIPHWKSRIKDKRTMVLWDQGIPPRCRRKVWCLKIGNQLNITKNTFGECTRRVPQAVRQNSKNTATANGDSHGAPMPIVTSNHHTTYDPYHQHPTSTAAAASSSEQLYRRTRQRRTSSLDVLRERKEDRHRHHEDEEDEEDEEETEEEEQDRVASFSNFTNMPTNHASSSTYSFTSNDDHFDRYSQSEGGRSALELGSAQGDDDSIALEDDDNDDDEEETDTNSDQEDGHNNGDMDDDKVLRDPAAINFLNKAIDEDILRTLPSLCVFQVSIYLP
ncbi:hypothetical protein MAM1_0023c01942 [Mucor ambiguus]|uniref:Rab-GAP TBC domain-containing protein n=1 Tax=Mucor ambiguus TaxID=91626 RepID=A0A0C9MKV8_9FUNG|nr:hypothetical protein MAM1_0023c01942 [Mucor ambiguus]